MISTSEWRRLKDKLVLASERDAKLSCWRVAPKRAGSFSLSYHHHLTVSSDSRQADKGIPHSRPPNQHLQQGLTRYLQRNMTAAGEHDGEARGPGSCNENSTKQRDTNPKVWALQPAFDKMPGEILR